MVSQEPVLFSGSVKDNITYGLGECSLQRVQEAARKANAHGFISQLEKGYDTGTQVLKRYSIIQKRKALYVFYTYYSCRPANVLI